MKLIDIGHINMSVMSFVYDVWLFQRTLCYICHRLQIYIIYDIYNKNLKNEWFNQRVWYTESLIIYILIKEIVKDVSKHWIWFIETHSFISINIKVRYGALELWMWSILLTLKKIEIFCEKNVYALSIIYVLRDVHRPMNAKPKKTSCRSCPVLISHTDDV